MMHGDRLTGGRYAPCLTTKWSKFHPVERSGRWVFCGCFASFHLEHQLGIKGNKFIGEIRSRKQLGRYRKTLVPVYQEWKS